MMRAVSLVCGDEGTLAAARSAAGRAGLTCAAEWADIEGGLPPRTSLAEVLRGADAAFIIRRETGRGVASFVPAAQEQAESAGIPLGAAEFGVAFYPVYLAWLRRARPDEHCLVIAPGADPKVLESVLASVWAEAARTSPGPAVPYKDLFDITFRHVQHEANWINSRFVWYMFANSALLGFVGTFRQNALVAGAVTAVGCLVTLATLLLQLVTFRAEQEAIDRSKAILAEWKERVPQVRTLLYDTPAGGNSETRHRAAKRLMCGVLGSLLLVWLFLAAKQHYGGLDP